MQKKIFFDKVTAYQTEPFCMAIVYSIVVFFIDHYCAGCILSALLVPFFHFVQSFSFLQFHFFGTEAS